MSRVRAGRAGSRSTPDRPNASWHGHPPFRAGRDGAGGEQLPPFRSQRRHRRREGRARAGPARRGAGAGPGRTPRSAPLRYQGKLLRGAGEAVVRAGRRMAVCRGLCLVLVLLCRALLGAAAAAGGERGGVRCQLGWDQRSGQRGTRRARQPISRGRGRCLAWVGFGEPGGNGDGSAESSGSEYSWGWQCGCRDPEGKRLAGEQPGAASSPSGLVGRVGLGCPRLAESPGMMWLGRDRRAPISFQTLPSHHHMAPCHRSGC